MSHDLETSTEMDGVAPIEQARRALRHVLLQIRERPEAGWYWGWGTQTFALATEAYAKVLGYTTVAEVRKLFSPVHKFNPGHNITWVYVSKELPDDETSVLLALRGSAEIYTGHHDDGHWVFDDGYVSGGRVVYAWSHCPEVPSEHGGDS